MEKGRSASYIDHPYLTSNKDLVLSHIRQYDQMGFKENGYTTEFRSRTDWTPEILQPMKSLRANRPIDKISRMDSGDLPKNLNTFLEEYLEKIGDDSKEIRRDLELIQELDEVWIDCMSFSLEIYHTSRWNW